MLSKFDRRTGNVVLMREDEGRRARLCSCTIDITYDAFGVTGPTTEVLIDVVGYLVVSGGGAQGPQGIQGLPGTPGLQRHHP